MSALIARVESLPFGRQKSLFFSPDYTTVVNEDPFQYCCNSMHRGFPSGLLPGPRCCCELGSPACARHPVRGLGSRLHKQFNNPPSWAQALAQAEQLDSRTGGPARPRQSVRTADTYMRLI